MLVRIYTYFLFTLFCIPSIALALDFQFSTLQEIRLPSPTTLNNKILGTAITVSNSTAAIAATTKNNINSGSVYIYQAEKHWKLITELSTPSTQDNFAKQTLLIGNRLIISADRDDEKGIDSGAVYIFEKNDTNQWQQTVKLMAPDTQTGDHFGQGIFLVNDTLYIGAPLHNQGKVYIFNYDSLNNSWNFQQNIEPTDSNAARFGYAIARDKNTLIIGAPYTDDPVIEKLAKKQPRFVTFRLDNPDLDGIESGSIFVYEKIADSWQPQARLTVSNRWSFDHFGDEIAISDNTIIAAIKHKFVENDLGAGNLYLFKKEKNTWSERIITADPIQDSAHFGVSTSLFDRHILVGAHQTLTNGINSGKVFLFDLDANKINDPVYQFANRLVSDNDLFGSQVSLGSEHILSASKHAVYAFQNRSMQQPSAFFYFNNFNLQLDEVAIPELGVYQATFKLSELAGDILLTLTDAKIRKALTSSPVNYLPNTGKLTIPRLAVQQVNGGTTFFSATLQKVKNSNPLQFKIETIAPI